MSWQLGLYASLIIQLIIISIVNVRTMLIPNKLIIVGLIIWFLLIIIFEPRQVLPRLACAAIVLGVLIISNLLTEWLLGSEWIGGGGIKLAALMALYLGTKPIAVIVLVSSCLIDFISYFVTGKREIPISPIFTVATIIALVSSYFGWQLL